MRAIHARSSSPERALASDSIVCGWRTFSSSETGSPPIRCVGESGVTSSGWSASIAAKLVEQRVVLVVADLGIVEDVVPVAVIVELPAQLGGALSGLPRGGLRRGHGSVTSLAAGAISCARS